MHTCSRHVLGVPVVAWDTERSRMRMRSANRPMRALEEAERKKADKYLAVSAVETSGAPTEWAAARGAARQPPGHAQRT